MKIESRSRKAVSIPFDHPTGNKESFIAFDVIHLADGSTRDHENCTVGLCNKEMARAWVFENENP